jgi:hypothetical protein
MKRFAIYAFSLALLLTASAVYADLPGSALHVVTAGRSEITVHPGDYIQLEHTYLLIQSPPKDAVALTTEKHVSLVKTLRVVNPKVLGTERATVGAMFRAETPGRSVLTLEIVEKNGKRKTILCQVDVK